MIWRKAYSHRGDIIPAYGILKRVQDDVVGDRVASHTVIPASHIVIPASHIVIPDLIRDPPSMKKDTKGGTICTPVDTKDYKMRDEYDIKSLHPRRNPYVKSGRVPFLCELD